MWEQVKLEGEGERREVIVTPSLLVGFELWVVGELQIERKE